MVPFEFDSIVCFGGEDWWYHNRGHIDMQMMRRFSRLGTTVYINSLVMQKPDLREGRKFMQKFARKTKSILTGLKKSDAGFWVYSPFLLPMHHTSWAKTFNKIILINQVRRIKRKLGMQNPIVWVTCPVACDIALNMKKAKLIYQRADKLEEFPGVDAETIKCFDKKLKSHADLTIFVNSSLFQEESKQCKNAFYLDHGVDYELFASAESNPKQPDDVAGVPRPIVGFYGGFAEHTTDISLLERVVDLLPNMSFVFVGQPSPECAALKARKNVWMLGQRPYEQIPHYGKCFDVAIMPWKQNRWIQGCNPIKLKEYLALGKPVVSTPFNELNKYLDVVYEAKTPKDFAQAIEKALTEDSPDRVAVRRNKIINASWDCKAQTLLNELFPNKGHNKADAIDGHAR